MRSPSMFKPPCNGELFQQGHIIAHPRHDYFEDEADKVQYFQNRFQIRPQEMP